MSDNQKKPEGLVAWARRLNRMVLRRAQFCDIGDAPGVHPYHPSAISKWAAGAKSLGWSGIQRLFLMSWGVRVAQGLDVPLEPSGVLSLSLYKHEEDDVEALIEWWSGRSYKQWDQQNRKNPESQADKSEFTCLRAFNSTLLEQWFVLVRSVQRFGVGRFAVLCEKSDRNRLIDELEKIGFTDSESSYESLMDAYGIGADPERMNADEVDWLLRGGGMDPRMFDMFFQRPPETSSDGSDVKCPPDYIKISDIKNPLLRVMLAAEKQGLSPLDLELLLRARSAGAVDFSKIPPAFMGIGNGDPWF